MMVQDMSPPPRERISTETLASLREALGRYAGDGRDSGELDGALTKLAAEARQRGIPPEEVLVELKTVWSTLPVAPSRRAADSETVLLQRVVTLCIKCYYR